MVTSFNFDNVSYVNKNKFGKWQESAIWFTLRQLAIWAGENIINGGNGEVVLLFQLASENTVCFGKKKKKKKKKKTF